MLLTGCRLSVRDLNCDFSRCLGMDGGTSRDVGTDGLEADSAVDAPVSDAGQPLPITSFGAGFQHACATRAGGLWCWGDNALGQLGLGDLGSRTRPMRVGARSDWLAVGRGGRLTNFSCAIRTGALHCWGDNEFGQLGIGESGVGSKRTEPTVVATGDWRTIALGQSYSCGLRSGDELWCWGENDQGQLGLGDLLMRSTPAQVGSSRWKQVSAGTKHACGIRQDDTLWCWGRNSRGQLGLGTEQIQARAPQEVGATWRWVACGHQHTLGVRSDGSLWGWGTNAQDQLGTGGGEVNAPARVGQSSNWRSVATSDFHSCGIRDDNTLWCWGRNNEGQLGQADLVDRPTPSPVADAWVESTIGHLWACALRRDGSTLACTGANERGQLGVNDLGRRSEFSDVSWPD